MFYYLAFAYTVPLMLYLCGFFREGSSDLLMWFLCPAIGLYLISLLLSIATETTKEPLTLMQRALTCCFCWILVSLVMTIPFLKFLSPTDAFFESVSAITTTGASILTGPMYHSTPFIILTYRSWLDWIGSLGFVYSFGYFMKEDISVGLGLQPPVIQRIQPGVQIMTESYLRVYIYLSLLMLVLLLFTGMPFLSAFCIVGGVMSTGGHTPWVDSLTQFSYLQNTISIVFMILAVTTFYLYIAASVIAWSGENRSIFDRLWSYLRTFVRSYDFRWMIGYYTVFNLLILGVILWWNGAQSFNTIFGVVLTCISSFATCGVSMNGTNWPCAALMLFFLGQLFGGMCFSTSGGIKIERIRILLNYVWNRMRNPQPSPISNSTAFYLNDKTVDYRTSLNDAIVVTILFVGTLFVLLFLMELSCQQNPMQLLWGLIECITNTGVGTGIFALTFAWCTIFQKYILIIAMLVGRVEVFPYLICLVGMYRFVASAL